MRALRAKIGGVDAWMHGKGNCNGGSSAKTVIDYKLGPSKNHVYVVNQKNNDVSLRDMMYTSCMMYLSDMMYALDAH